MSRDSAAIDADPVHLAPGKFIDSNHPRVIAFAERAVQGAEEPAATAVKLYHAVRDGILYDPYVPYDEPDTYRASAVLARWRGYSVGKAALLAVAARARGIPARVALADARNHLATPRLLELIGTDLFIFHGIAELRLSGRWVKATPTFNLSLCEKFHNHPLEFDRRSNAVLHPFDRTGRRHTEYVNQRDSYLDVPVGTIMPAMLAAYPRIAGLKRGRGSDFEKEAADVG